MVEKLIILAVLVAAVQGSAVMSNARHGSFNTYYLYSRSIDNGRTRVTLPTVTELLAEPTENIAGLSSSQDTIVVIHGHGGDADSTLNPMIKNAFFDPIARPNIDVNVIVVDWSTYTKQSYSVASDAVHHVGKVLGEYLKILVDQRKIVVSRIHLIGFNLGAHVAGFAGRELGGDAARITGLDPSGSGWGSNSPRLSKNDARYVEVFHTDGDGLLANGIGTPIGHVDFFVNGGSNQPGCLTRACSHNRAYELFAATLVRSEPLVGRLCSSNLQLSLNLCKGIAIPVGGDALFKLHGNDNLYRVNTGRSFPY